MTTATASSMRRRLIALATLIVALTASANAQAYWMSNGWGSGISLAASLEAPSLSGTPGAGTAALSWSAVTPPGSGTVSYYVSRDGANAGGDCPTPTAPASITTCTDSGLSAGTYSYTVTAVWRTWTSTSSPAISVIVASGGIHHFLLAAASTTPNAGAADNLTITAKDSADNTVLPYTGSHNLTFAGASAIGSHNPTVANSSGTATNFGSATAITFTNGIATVSGASNGVMRLYRAGSANITVAEDGSYTSNAVSVTVSPLGISTLSLAAASTTPSVGAADNLTLTALDAYGNTATSYTGSHNLTFVGADTIGSYNPTVTNSSGTAIAFGSATAITFTNGVATVSGASNGVMRLYKAETASITVAEGGSYTSNALSVTANPLGISSLSLAVASATPSAGAADNLTITAKDTYGNTATSYNATLNLTFSGGTGTRTVTNSSGAAINFGTATALSFVSGVASVTGSSNGAMTLYTVQTANIGATGGAYTTNTISVTVGPGPFASFTIPNPGTRTAGSAFNLTISAFDAYGNASDFSGSRCLTFTGASASPNNVAPLYPAQGSCAAGQSEVTFTNGSASPSITLYNAVSTTLTVTDVTTGTARAVGPFAVNAGPRGGYHLVPAATTQTAGTTNNLTIYDADAYGNHVAGYTGNRNLYFSGARSIGTYDPTVIRYNTPTTAIDFNHSTTIRFNNGVATVASGRNGVMTLYRAETAHIVVSDGNYDNGDGVEVTVSPAAMSNISLSAEKVVVRPGATDNLTIRAIDIYGNSAPGYSDGPHNLTFAGGTGTRTVTNSSGTQVNFGTATSITFTNGISTAGGVMRINTAQTANITVTDGTHTSAALRIVVSNVSASMVSAGGFHTCAVRSDGAVECWGLDDSGQLGNGNPLTNSSNPVLVSGLTNVTQVSAGKYHTCALRNDGTVWCWGLNDYGQLGNNSTTDSPTPVQVRGVGGTGYLTGVTEVGADGKFTCARLSSGEVRCWGRNQSGQLGNGTNNNSSTPVAVVDVGGSGTLTGVSAITTGANHACALLSSGGVDCWGLNDHGQLGDDNSPNNSSDPVQVRGAGGTGYLAGVTEINGGRMHVCALLSDSTVYCWGRNENGELGDGTTTNRSFPVRAGSISTATSVSAGEYHSCARLADGTAQCWGAAAFGQIGDGTTADTSTPVTVIGPGGFGVLAGIAEISAGGGDINETDDFEHTCALMNDGTVVCWGQNNYGQLGEGTTTMSIFPAGVALL